MPIRDTFKYTARWDSVGLDCSNCINEMNPNNWPDVNRVYSCKLHKIYLSVELNKEGYKEGEWFCKNFNNKGDANIEALKNFEAIRPKLSENVLYGFYGENGYLKEIPFSELRKVDQIKDSD